MNKNFFINYFQFNSNSILISWENSIENDIIFDVLSFKNAINDNIKQILEVRNAYTSLLVTYEYSIDNIYSEIKTLKQVYLNKIKINLEGRKTWRIPVCYDKTFSKDLDNISTSLNLSRNQIIKLHHENKYMVCFIGFLPGFLYLSNLNKKLYFPRKSVPDLSVAKGSVGIGGSQTGVYPSDSPGGWNIIGNSPVNFINTTTDRISFAHPGDLIKFYPITLKEHQLILKESNKFKFEREASND